MANFEKASYYLKKYARFVYSEPPFQALVGDVVGELDDVDGAVGVKAEALRRLVEGNGYGGHRHLLK